MKRVYCPLVFSKGFPLPLVCVFGAFHGRIEQWHCSWILLFSKPLFKCTLFSSVFMLMTVFRDEYIYRRELVWPSCLSIIRNAILTGRVFEGVRPEIMHVRVCVFEWLTLYRCWQCMCCYELSQPSFMVFGILWDGDIDICEVLWARSAFFSFVSEGSDQKNRSQSLITSR